jgi:hypothetical protein
LLAALASTSIVGAADTVVRMGSTTGASGQEVTARLEVLGVPEPGLGAFTIDVGYNPDIVSPVSCEGDPAKALDSVVCNPGYKTGSVRVGGYRMADGLTGDTALADITFRLSGDEGDCSDLTVTIVELTDPSTAALSSPQVENGSICIDDAAAATSRPGQSAGTTAPNGEQQPAGTVAPGETGGTLQPGQTPRSSPAAASSTTQASENGGATAKATPGSATGNSAGKPQAGESGSGGGSSRWLIAIGVTIGAVALAGIGAVVWRRRASPRL